MIYSVSNKLKKSHLLRDRIIEANIDHDMRSKSPYFNGQKNIDYLAPHFASNIVFY